MSTRDPAPSLLRARLQLVEPVLGHDQHAGITRCHLAHHQESLVVGSDGVRRSLTREGERLHSEEHPLRIRAKGRGSLHGTRYQKVVLVLEEDLLPVCLLYT